MKKLLFILLFLAFVLPSYALNPWEEDDGLKYSIVRITSDYSPLLKAPNSNAPSVSYLKKNMKIYVERYNSDFYMLDVGLERPFWLEKKYTALIEKVPDKGGAKLSSVKLYQNRKNYLVKIKTKNEIQAPYLISQDGNNVHFRLYNIDSRRDKKEKYNPKKRPYKVKGKNKSKQGETFNMYMIKQDHLSNIFAINYTSRVPVFSYDVKKEKDSLVLEIRKPVKVPVGKPLKNIKITLDAGHGGNDTGNTARGINEKDLNLQITKKLKKSLKKRGAKVVMTRKKDINVSLSKRLDIASKNDSDYLISIHQNSLKNPENYKEIHGSGVYYYNENAKNLAYSVQKSLVRATNFKDDGVSELPFPILKTTSPASIMVECGYIIHPYERAKLSDKEFQKIVADGIANGVENHLKNVRNHHYKRLKHVRRNSNL